MLFHTVFVVSAFLGWEVGGIHRSVMMIPLPGVKRSNARLTAAVRVSVGCWDGVAGSAFLFWLAPIVFSLILSPFVSGFPAVPPLVCAPNAGNCS